MQPHHHVSPLLNFFHRTYSHSFGHVSTRSFSSPMEVLIASFTVEGMIMWIEFQSSLSECWKHWIFGKLLLPIFSLNLSSYSTHQFFVSLISIRLKVPIITAHSIQQYFPVWFSNLFLIARRHDLLSTVHRFKSVP